jgi:hypothetical protein
MAAGMPGTGIGGLFYVACALWMPFHEVYRKVRFPHEPRRWRSVLKHFAIAISVAASLLLMGWILLPIRGTTVGGGGSGAESAKLIAMSATALTVLLLAAVLLIVEVTRWKLATNRRPIAIPLPPLGQIVRRRRVRTPIHSGPHPQSQNCDPREHRSDAP